VRNNSLQCTNKKEKFADYVLSLKLGRPLAALETNGNAYSIGSGLRHVLQLPAQIP
jgi:type I restriction enzyme R subunit